MIRCENNFLIPPHATLVDPETCRLILERVGKKRSQVKLQVYERPIDSRVQKAAFYFLGLLSRLFCFVLGAKAPLAIRVCAASAKKGVFFSVVQQPESTRISFAKWMPSLGLMGLVTGLGLRLLDHASWNDVLTKKNESLCRSAFDEQVLLQNINDFKQWEIKHLAFLTPLVIPACVELVRNFVQLKAGNISTRERIAKAAKQTFWNKKGAYLATLMGLGLCNSFYINAVNSLFENFKLSGHLLLKTVCAAALSAQVDALVNDEGASKKSKVFWVAYTALYGLTDAVLIHNTSRYCHTPYEVLGGLGLGLSIPALIA